MNEPQNALQYPAHQRIPSEIMPEAMLRHLTGLDVLLSTVSREASLDESLSLIPGNTTSIVNKGVPELAWQLSADIWFALSISTAVDATSIVFNGNRSLIHQFHYCVSMKMLCLATIISIGAYIILSKSEKTEGIYHSGIVILLGGISYIICVFIMDMLRKLVPSRSMKYGNGSLQGFLAQIGCFDVSWIRASLYTVIGGGFGVVLLLLLPAKYAVFIPPMHFTFEVSGVIVRSCAGLCRISVTNTTLKYRLVDILNINGKQTDPTV